MTDPNGIASEGFVGHKPQSDGRCEHRWRNRQTKIVTCRYADGWHAGRVTLAPALAALKQIEHAETLTRDQAHDLADRRMQTLIGYAVEVWGPESDVDPEADNPSMRADLKTFLYSSERALK